MAEASSAKTLLGICLVVIAVLGYNSFRRGQEIDQLKVWTAVSAPAPSKMAALSKGARLEDQGACARQAAVEFKREGLKSGTSDDFTSHFSVQTNHCYMVTSSSESRDNIPTTSKALSDAFEGKGFGTYLWINLEGKKFWEVAPKICTVTMPDGEEKQCASDTAWDELAKVYMEAP